MSSYFTRALEALKPNSEWAVTGDQYSRLTWLDKTQTKPTEEEVIAKVAELKAEEPMKLLREKRNKLIAETDWTQGRDVSLSNDTDWKNYRQALRDLPSKSNPKLDSVGDLDMSSVTWPTKPSS
tara:strand:+ start:146 stop:517 length:372 start_codon:yes stop_codon:yes gene_type:complete